jgi:hypothetical protein
MWKTRVFKTREQMRAFLTANDGRIQWHEIFVNNAYGVEYRPLRCVG